MPIPKTKADCLSCYSLKGTFSFRSTINCFKPCSEVEWRVSWHFYNIPWQFWFKLLLYKFWCIAMHNQRLFLLYVASNSGKMYWDCKLPCVEAQIELSSTTVYDQKMSTSGSSARNSHLTGDEWQWCPCLRTDLYKHVLQSKT